MFLNGVISRFRRGSAARDVAVLMMGTVLAQAVTIVVTPLLTRLYSPAEFGLLAVFLALVSVGATLGTLRYEAAILVPRENSESAHLVLLSLILAGALSIVLAALVVFLPVEGREELGLGGLSNWLSIAFFTAGATAVFTVMQNWMNREKKYNQMAFLRVGQSVGIAGVSIVLGLLGVSSGLLISQVLVTVCLCFFALWLGRSVALFWEVSELKKTAFEHKNSPKYLLPTAVLDVATLQLPVVLIAAWFGADDAGQFSMAWRLLMLPMALIGGAIGHVFMQRFCGLISSPITAEGLIRRSWFYLFLIGLIPFFLIFLFSDYIFFVVLGEEWEEAGAIAKVLVPMAFVMFISSPTSGSFVALGLQKYSLFFGLFSSVYRPLSLWVGYCFGDLYLGLWVWVFFEILQVFLYQAVVLVCLRRAY